MVAPNQHKSTRSTRAKAPWVVVIALGCSAWLFPMTTTPTDVSSSFSPQFSAGPDIKRVDAVTGAGMPHRRLVRTVRDLLENRFDVDALPWDTPITVWTADREVVAFTIRRPEEFGGTITAAQVPVDDGGGIRWILDDGSSLDGAHMARLVRYQAVSSKMGYREHPIRRKLKWHAGTDFAAPIGTPIRSFANGTVLKAEKNWVSGKFIAIRHDDGHVSKYLHLDQFAPNMQTGVRVGQGEVIGTVGKTGRVTGPHLHFELRDKWGYPVDPTTVSWPGARRLDDARTMRALALRLELLSTWRADGSRALLHPLLEGRAGVGRVPPHEVQPPVVLPPIAPVRSSMARARLTPPPRLRRKKLVATTQPLFDDIRTGVRLDDPLIYRAQLLSTEFPEDPAFG